MFLIRQSTHIYNILKKMSAVASPSTGNLSAGSNSALLRNTSSADDVAEEPYAVTRGRQGAFRKRKVFSGLLLAAAALGAAMTAAVVGRRLWLKHHPTRPLENSRGGSGSTGKLLVPAAAVDPRQPPVHSMRNRAPLPAELQSLHPEESAAASQLIPPGKVRGNAVFPLINKSQSDALAQLPTLIEVHQRLSAPLLEGRSHLVRLLREAEKSTPAENSVVRRVVRILGHLIGGDFTSLSGLEVNLVGRRTARGNLRFNVRMGKLLWWDSSSVAFEAVNTSTGQALTLRFLYRETDGSGDFLYTSGTFLNEALSDKLEVMRQACGTTERPYASSTKGFAVALFTGPVKGAPDCLIQEGIAITSQVQVMERLHMSVPELLSKVELLPKESKVYIAKLMLLEVLHLHGAGLSAQGVDLSSFYLKKDGSVLLADFGSSIEPPLRTPRHSSANGAEGGGSTQPRDDLRGFGRALYKLFIGDQQEMDTEIKQVRDAWRLEREKAEIPSRWRLLISKLTQEAAVNTQELVVAFQDLYG